MERRRVCRSGIQLARRGSSVNQQQQDVSNVFTSGKCSKLNIMYFRFRSIARSYFRKAHGVLLLYDVTSEGSFLNVRAWVDQIQVTGKACCSNNMRNECQRITSPKAGTYFLSFVFTGFNRGENPHVCYWKQGGSQRAACWGKLCEQFAWREAGQGELSSRKRVSGCPTSQASK